MLFFRNWHTYSCLLVLKVLFSFLSSHNCPFPLHTFFENYSWYDLLIFWSKEEYKVVWIVFEDLFRFLDVWLWLDDLDKRKGSFFNLRVYLNCWKSRAKCLQIIFIYSLVLSRLWQRVTFICATGIQKPKLMTVMFMTQQ